LFDDNIRFFPGNDPPVPTETFQGPPRFPPLFSTSHSCPLKTRVLPLSKFSPETPNDLIVAWRLQFHKVLGTLPDIPDGPVNAEFGSQLPPAPSPPQRRPPNRSHCCIPLASTRGFSSPSLTVGPLICAVASAFGCVTPGIFLVY